MLSFGDHSRYFDRAHRVAGQHRARRGRRLRRRVRAAYRDEVPWLPDGIDGDPEADRPRPRTAPHGDPAGPTARDPAASRVTEDQSGTRQLRAVRAVGARPLTWSTSVERGRRLYHCERCSRENVRAMEGKLDPEWW